MLNYFFRIALFLLLPASLIAQVSNYVTNVSLTEAKEGSELTVKVDLTNINDISEVIFLYRVFGTSEFTRTDMELSGGTARITLLPDDLRLPSLEYYFIIETRNNGEETYPLEAVAKSYLVVQVQPRSAKDDEVIVLNPEPGMPMQNDEMLVTLSLLKASDEVDKTKTKIYINGTDLSADLFIAEDLVILTGDNLVSNLRTGTTNSMRVELYKKDGSAYHAYSASFNVSDKVGKKVDGIPLEYYVNLRGESRNETVRETNRWYNNISLDGKASYGAFDFDAQVYATSEEKGFLQPYNRYKFGVYNEYFRLIGGDYTPGYQTLVMNGKRVRGVTGSVHLGFFNVQASYGEINRGVDGTIAEILGPNASLLGSDKILLADGNVARINQGTFKRNVFAVNPYFTAGETFKLGFTYLHSKDDKTTAQYTRQPQENVVAGTDLTINLDDSKIQLYAQGAFSVLNKDIETGDLSNETIDKVFGPNGAFSGNSEDIKKIKDILSQFITFNQFLSPLKPEELSSLAYEASLALNYFGNYFKGTYLSRGFDYNSFGNNYLRTDVSGFNLFDRVALLDNKMFLSLGYERLEDNRNKTKFATTAFTNFNASISYYPSFDLPGVILSYSRNENNNGILSTDPDIQRRTYGIDDYTNRFGVQVTYRFFAGYNHNLSATGSFASRKDNTVFKFDANNTMLGLNYATEWSKSLQSFLTLNMSNNEIINGSLNTTQTFNITSIVAGAKYYMMQNKLVLNGSVAPTFGDLKRYAFDASALYYILQNLSLQLQVRYLVNDGFANDSIVGLTSRYELR